MDNLTVIIRTAPASCWSCGADTRIVSSLHLSCGGEAAECSIADLTDYPALIRDLDGAMPDLANMGKIKPRSSKTLARAYMSNGCVHCDALFGQHFEIHTRYAEQDSARLIVPDAAGWATLFRSLLASEDGHLFHL